MKLTENNSACSHYISIFVWIFCSQESFHCKLSDCNGLFPHPVSQPKPFNHSIYCSADTLPLIPASNLDLQRFHSHPEARDDSCARDARDAPDSSLHVHSESHGVPKSTRKATNIKLPGDELNGMYRMYM